jgi:16S rRNA (adenine1518-N6/adenine1519-N6)-dimethyltransferase
MEKRKKPVHKRGAKLGQHFLTRPEIAGWVADAAGLTPACVALEIGPGHGILTRELLKRTGKVIALEKDAVLVRELRDTFAPELASGRLLLIEQDVRDFDPSTPNSLVPGAYSLVANIPYYLTGYIIRTFLTAQHQPVTMSLLVQKEVAERIVAMDGRGSLLSLSVQAYGTPHYVRTIKAGAFSPPPTVDSAVLSITDISRAGFACTDDETRFFEVIRAGFSSKRKLLKRNIAGLVEPSRFLHCNISENARAEELVLAAWRCLSRRL